jgi:hypothetical protein
VDAVTAKRRTARQREMANRAKCRPTPNGARKWDGAECRRGRDRRTMDEDRPCLPHDDERLYEVGPVVSRSVSERHYLGRLTQRGDHLLKAGVAG